MKNIYVRLPCIKFERQAIVNELSDEEGGGVRERKIFFKTINNYFKVSSASQDYLAKLCCRFFLPKITISTYILEQQ